MHINLAYGNDQIPIDVPDNWINGRCYRPQPLEACADAYAEMIAAIEDLPSEQSLEKVAAGKKTCAIVVDAEEPVLARELLPHLIEIIEDNSDLSPRDFTIILTNRAMDPFEPSIIEEIIPEEVRATCQVVLHNFFDSTEVVKLGVSATEVPLSVNKHYLDGKLRIILGAVRPHMLYGFTGGRSVVMPGLAGKSTLKAIYDFNIVANRNVKYGNFRDNPFHQVGLETLNEAGCDLAISAVTNNDGAIHKVYAGHFGTSHVQAMAYVREALATKVKEPMDIVVTCGGGSPNDSRLDKIIHTLCAVEPVLKQDGTIVIAAELGEGFGPEVIQEVIRNHRNVRDTMRKISVARQFVPGLWLAQKFYSILQQHEVILYNTSLEDDRIWSTGMTPARDMNEAVFAAMESHGQRCKIVALPEGHLGIGMVQTS